MLKTTNYQMNKPELTDSPPDITVLNKNFDIIDEELFAIIKAWEDFKASGGEIGGDIILSTGSKVDLAQGNLRGETGNVTLEANPDNVFLFKTKRSTDDREVTITIVNNDIEACVRPTGATGTGKVDLGNPTVSFKDIFLSGVLKSANGYDKLPNGFILQWGVVSTTSNVTAEYTFPIAFPTECLFTHTSLQGGNAYSNLGTTGGKRNRFSGYALQCTGATRDVNWLAIGY